MNVEVKDISYVYNQHTDHMIIGLYCEDTHTITIGVKHWLKNKMRVRDMLYCGDPGKNEDAPHDRA